jgi:mono/diheme cytochrome c family protein
MQVTWPSAFMAACVAIGIAQGAWAQSPDRGKSEYLRSCEPCHGIEGKGDGSNTMHLPRRPADLTKLSQSNGGVFPFVRVFESIDGRLEIALHGPREMPVWGDRYKRELISEMPKDAVSNDMANVLARRRILELIEYISTTQGK